MASNLSRCTWGSPKGEEYIWGAWVDRGSVYTACPGGALWAPQLERLSSVALLVPQLGSWLAGGADRCSPNKADPADMAECEACTLGSAEGFVGGEWTSERAQGISVSAQ